MYKRILFFFIMNLIVFCLQSCEDTVDIDFESENPRLIVRAFVEVDINEEFTLASFIFTVSSPFNNNERPERASPSNVSLRNSVTGEIIFYDEVGNVTGLFSPQETQGTEISQGNSLETNFFLTQGSQYILTFDYEGKSYRAESYFLKSSPIIIDQVNVISENEREIIVRFQDIINEENYYIIEFDGRNFLPASDRFFENGEAIIKLPRILENDDDTSLEAVRNLGANEQLFNYFNAILDQSEMDDPTFQIPRSTVRGNIIELENGSPTQNPNNFVLGYFAISQRFKDTVEIE